MPGTTVTLSGSKAVLALVVIAGVVGFRITTAEARLDTQGRAALQRWVQAELVRPILADTTQSPVEQASALTQASSVKIQSLSVRGRLSNAVVRVELSPSPALPPGTELVRSYRMRYSEVTGWMHQGSATVLNWYLAAF